MVLSKSLKVISFFVVLLSISVIVIERYLPEQKDCQNVDELPQELASWFRRGKYFNVFGHRVFAIWESDSYDERKETIILIHGFPSSSFDYHRSFNDLESSGYHVLLFDHLGFGFSDKPKEGFVYSLHDHAEVALELWRQLGIRHAHVVAHDMGDSILTEILTRRQKRMLPDYFNDFFQSVTFTNGGMKYDLINFRLSQVLLRVPIIGPFLGDLSAKLPFSMSNMLARQQLLSIWGPIDDGPIDATVDVETEKRRSERDFDIETLISLNRFKGGNKITYQTIMYLNDRSRFESRWFASLTKLDLPCFLLWGDSDAVSPVEIPKFLAQNVLPYNRVKGTTLKDTGHFLMLERPRDWSKLVLDFISKNLHSKEI